MGAATQKLIDLDVELDAEEVLRTMGCRPGHNLRAEHRLLMDRLLSEARPALSARAVYTIADVEHIGENELRLRECRPIRGPIASFLKPSRRVVAFVATIGEAIERMADERFQAGDKLGGYTLNAIGSAAADAAVDALADAIYFSDLGPDEALTPPFSPGYCGMPLEEQLSIFSIVQAAPIGVRLLPSMIMKPLKSVSGLIGIGPNVEIEARGVPCQWCELTSCRMRRTAR